MENNEHVFFLFFVNQHHYHHHHHHHQTWESLKGGNRKMGVHVVKGARLFMRRLCGAGLTTLFKNTRILKFKS